MPEPATNRKHETVLDVTAQQIARVYAQALLGAAQSSGQLDDVVETMDALVDEVLESHPGLDRVLTSALISAEEKEQTLDRVFGQRVAQIVLSFLKVLSRHGRLNLIRDIRRELWSLYAKHRNLLEVQVRTAQNLDEETQAEIRRVLSERFHAEAVLNVTVDPSLIAGLVIRVDDTVYDASVATRFRRAKDAMVRQAVELIQTRREQLIAT